MSLVFLVSDIVVDQDNSGDDTNTWVDSNPAVALITETDTHHLCPSTVLDHEEGEDEDTSQAALNLSRITIVGATSAHDKGEAPQWMIDALKVGPVQRQCHLELTNVMEGQLRVFC